MSAVRRLAGRIRRKLHRIAGRQRATVSKSQQDLGGNPQPGAAVKPRSPQPARIPVTEDNIVLAGLQAGGEHPRVVIVLHSFAVRMIFAGVRTALVTAVELARRMQRSLALVVLEPLGADPDVVRSQLIEWITTELDASDVVDGLTLSAPERPRHTDSHPDDIWLATYWTTAYQLGRMCDRGVLDPDHVVYLVQDWEPGFFAWGTEYALASSTYTRGFHTLVNSVPLASYVTEQTGISIPTDQIIAPQVDEARLRSVAEAWQPGPSGAPRVLYYARPSKPRNMYALGLAALRMWAADLPPALRPVVTLSGEDLIAPDLGSNVEVRVAGKLTFNAYYSLLAHTDVGLTLMYSPHPSHLALELPMAGIPTVTNALGDYRRSWLPGLDVVPATPYALADALAARVSEVGAHERHDFVSLGHSLGLPLESCLDALVAKLPSTRADAAIESRGAGYGS